MKELKVEERVTITLEVVEEKNCLPCEECFGNWMNCHIKGVATKEQISEFFAKVRKTQKIINY